MQLFRRATSTQAAAAAVQVQQLTEPPSHSRASSLPSTKGSRAVSSVIDEEHAIEGPGFEITRPFPTRALRMFDPWLLLDAFGPKTLQPGHPATMKHKHLGQHPHQGFEAITYVIEGGHDHYDSTGKHGRLSPGSVQLMTAGGGIVHGGAPTPEVQARGGRTHGYQIWLALPAAQRMCAARTIDLHADQTPVVKSPDNLVWARVLASSIPVYGATCTALPTAQPIMLVHFVVQPGGHVRQQVPAGFNAMVHVSIGQGMFGPGLTTPAHAEQSVLFASSDAASSVDAQQQQQQQQQAAWVEFACPQGAQQPLDVLLLAGQPTKETIVQYGPFVGGSMADIHTARAAYQAGLMGALAEDGSAAPRSKWAAAA